MKRIVLCGSIAIALLVGGAQAADSLTLTLVSQTSTTITLGWTPQPGYGYLFSADGNLVSRTNDPNRSTARFSKSYSTYEVAVIVKGLTGTYPPATPPPPPPPSGTAPWLGSFDASYRNAQPGQVVVVPAGTYGSQIIGYRNLPACNPNDPAQLVTLDVPNTVTINGNLEVHGTCVYIKGRATGTIQTWKSRTFTVNVTGYTSMEGDSATQWPRGVRIEGLNTGNLGTYSSEDVIVRDADVGPRLLDVPCQYPENRISQNGAAAGKTPKNILWERVAIHDQNRTQAAANQDCHYGGLQFWGAINARITHSVFERNVVYQVEVQGPSPGEISFTSFGCPADNSWLGDRCDGQRAVQFRTTTGWGTGFVLTGNVAANGPNGLYGCYESPCDFSVMAISGNTDLAQSTTAPPVP